MGAHKVKIRLKNNQELVVFISPKDESDIFVGGNSPYADFQLIEGKRYYFELDNPAYIIRLLHLIRLVPVLLLAIFLRAIMSEHSLQM